MCATTNNGLSITLRGREIPIARKMLRQTSLRFYLQNPRVYSAVHQNGDGEPDQDDILEALSGMEHVKQLVHAIRQNGGLTDPLLVRGHDSVVLEGNSRLAAYRILARNEPVRWGVVKCDVVTASIDDLEVKTLLTHYHIIGRKSWDPFEQAGMFWRWHQEGVSLDEIASRVEEMGISSRKIRHWIDVYSLMVERRDTDPSKWSHYDVLLASNQVKKVEKQCPGFTATVLKEIKAGKVRAVDVRDKVSKIAKVGGKTAKAFVEGRATLEKAVEEAEAGGASDVLYNQMHRFREVIQAGDVSQKIEGMPKTLREKCKLELTLIKSGAERLQRIIDRLGG